MFRLEVGLLAVALIVGSWFVRYGWWLESTLVAVLVVACAVVLGWQPKE